MLLLEGLKLMGVGMTTVMLFLLLMIVCIMLMARLPRKQAQLEETGLVNQQASLKSVPPPAKQAAVPVQVFAASIAVYEEERKQLAAPT